MASYVLLFVPPLGHSLASFFLPTLSQSPTDEDQNLLPVHTVRVDNIHNITPNAQFHIYQVIEAFSEQLNSCFREDYKYLRMTESYFNFMDSTLKMLLTSSITKSFFLLALVGYKHRGEINNIAIFGCQPQPRKQQQRQQHQHKIEVSNY